MFTFVAVLDTGGAAHSPLPTSAAASVSPLAAAGPTLSLTPTHIATPRDFLLQVSSIDLNLVGDPTSREHQMVRKAKSILAAVRMQSGDQAAQEVYLGFQLMHFYDMIGVLSTDLWSDVYRQRVDARTHIHHSTPTYTGLVAGPSQLPAAQSSAPSNQPRMPFTHNPGF